MIPKTSVSLSSFLVVVLFFLVIYLVIEFLLFFDFIHPIYAISK